MTFRMLAAALAVGATLALAGCVPSDPVVVPVETGVVAPIFTSDEEALAAAVERYEDYISVSDQVSAGGTSDAASLKPYLTKKQYEIERAAIASSTTRSVGNSTFDRVQLQQRWINENGVDHLTLYLCLDFSEVRIIDSKGVDRTPAERTNRLALEVEFEINGHEQDSIQIARSELWPDQQYCD